MRALRTFTLLIALAGASTAHADANVDAEQAPPMSEIHSEKLLAFFNELVDQTVKNAADCQALASAVDGVVNRHLNTVQMTWAAKKAKKQLAKDVQEKLDRRAVEMVSALRRCLDDARVKAAFARMKIPKDKQP